MLQIFLVHRYPVQTEAIFLKFFFSTTSWPDKRPRRRRLGSAPRRRSRRCPRAPERRNESGRGARASWRRSAVAPPTQESSEQSPAPRGPGSHCFTSLFYTPPTAPQPTGPGRSAGQSACGLVGKVEGGDVSGEQLFAFGAEAARELLGHEPASPEEGWRFWIAGKARGRRREDAGAAGVGVQLSGLGPVALLPLLGDLTLYSDPTSQEPGAPPPEGEGRGRSARTRIESSGHP